MRRKRVRWVASAYGRKVESVRQISGRILTEELEEGM